MVPGITIRVVTLSNPSSTNRIKYEQSRYKSTDTSDIDEFEIKFEATFYTYLEIYVT